MIPTVPHEWLAHRAEAMSDKLALRTDAADLTFAEYEFEVASLAARYFDAGHEEGQLKGVPVDASTPKFPITLFGLLRAGGVVVPESPNLPNAPEPPASADTACRLYTSGTTGDPKRVDLTATNFAASAMGTAFALGIGPTDRWLCCLPFSHVAGIAILWRGVMGGNAVVLHDGFDVDRVARSFAEDGITLVSLVATQIVRLLEAGVDLSGPRAIIAGGGPIPVEVLEEAAGRGATVVQSYGMTETTSQVTLLEIADAKRMVGSAGRQLLGAQVKIDEGEIVVRGPVVAPGSVGEDGWLRTGDLGTIDSEGYLWVEGRRDDLIVTGGENVMPQRVEKTIESHPDVVEAAVVGRPDPEWQEAVTAIVVLRPGAPEDADALAAHCRAELAGYEVPKRFVFVADLPRTASGKLMRSVLR